MFGRMTRVLAAAALVVTGALGAQSDAAQAAPAAAADGSQVMTAAAVSAPVYNDAYRTSQWAMTRLAGETLRAHRKATGIVVAVIDSGVDGAHPDLQGHLVPGWDFTTNRPGGTVDGYGHGTHVAGVITADANNRIGVAGLAPDAKIMPLRVLDSTGRGTASMSAAALRYAADHGAKVANMSIAGGYSAMLADAVRYAQGKGVIVVAAAGNNRAQGSPVSYPAALPGVIAVAAETSTGAVASYSNIGRYVAITAPGSTVISTYKGRYASLSGTSMATPYVSATVAVLAAAKPGLTPAQARTAIQSTARDMGVKGIDTATGAGEIQPLKALCTLQRCA